MERTCHQPWLLVGTAGCSVMLVLEGGQALLLAALEAHVVLLLFGSDCRQNRLPKTFVRNEGTAVIPPSPLTAQQQDGAASRAETVPWMFPLKKIPHNAFDTWVKQKTVENQLNLTCVNRRERRVFRRKTTI